MKNAWARVGNAVLFALALAGCGGGNGGGGTTTPPPEPGSLAATLQSAAAVPSNDTSTNSSASFTVLQAAGVPAVTVASPPKVNFTVFSDGKVKTGLALSNMSFAIAKLVPGTDGAIDQWVNYVYRTETAAAGVGPGGSATPRATALQATTDPKPAAQAATQLVYNEAGYYTYTFSTDITDPARTQGVVFEPGRTHRVAIQLDYMNDAGERIRVNPYIDVTFDASGNSVPVTDPALTRKMADVGSCNSCHDKLMLHGGGRVDVQYCVMCHNPGTTDANSGHVLTMSTMVHKIHAGRRIASPLAAGGSEEHYTIWGFQNSQHDYAEIGFPQDLRNCTKCHDGANPATPQGDNWKTRVSREACLTCHASKEGSNWYATHFVLNSNRDPNAPDTLMTNSDCLGCHRPGTAVAPERVHWNQNEENAAKYKMNIEDATYDPATRAVTVKYFLSDPTNGDAAYNLVTSDCTGSAETLTCGNTTKFGALTLYVAYQNLVGQTTAVTEFTSRNNGGRTVSAAAYKGVNDGSNHYTAQIALPADSATAVAAGTARVVTIGQIREPRLEVKSLTDPRPVVTPTTLVNVVAQHTYKDVALSGPLTPRRDIVSNDKCNACHGALGTTSGSNTLANAFHRGARNTVEACAFCHDPNLMSSSTKMANGLGFNESYQFKRMIHGIHGNSKRTYPFTHGNPVSDTPLCKDPADAATTGCTPVPEGVENYAAEVHWPGVGLNCNACHVNDSWKVDRGPIGSVIAKPTGVTDPLQWLVISPKAATCTACHDSPRAMGHVTSFGNASFGNLTQAQTWQTPETCADCHAPGLFMGVDVVHGLK